MKYLYVHGLGQTPDSWNQVVRGTTVSDSSTCVDLAKLVKGKAVTYEALYSAFSGVCDAERQDLILCGLSLGGVLALNYAIDHPRKVKALILIAAQYKMPKRLLKVQNALFRCMPESMFRQTGFGKADFIRLCSTMADLDFRDSLHRVSCPVLLICGEKDKANKKASKELADCLPHSGYQELPKTGHEANVESPEELSSALQKFYESIPQIPACRDFSGIKSVTAAVTLFFAFRTTAEGTFCIESGIRGKIAQEVRGCIPEK